MEIKEFNSVEEAIEALNNIKPIDYSSLDNVDEISERAFYNMLMNNFIGTKNLKFTPEQRRNYQEALKRKGLLTYKEWKSSRPKNPDEPEKMDWNYVVEHGNLDGPVNIFSNLMNAQDERQFDRIRDLTITDKLHSKVGKMWAEKNDEILEAKIAEREAELEKQKMEAEAKAIKEAEEKKRAEEAQKIMPENEMAENEIKSTMEKVVEEENQIKAQEKQEVEKVENETQKKQPEKPIVNGYDGTERRIEVEYYDSVEKAIEALKQIEKMEYVKGQKVDSIKEKDFYTKVSKNLMGCQKLEFTDEVAANYQEALKNLGCKEKEELIELRDDVEGIKVVEEYIDKVLKATKEDNYQGLKVAKSEADGDERLEDWVAFAESDLLLEAYKNKHSRMKGKEAKASKKETAMVEYKPRPKWIKNLARGAAWMAATFIGFFSIHNMNENNKNVEPETKDNKANVESGSMGLENAADKAFKDLTGGEKRQDEKSEVGTENGSFRDKLNEDVQEHARVNHDNNRSSGNNQFRNTPNDNAEISGESNEKAAKEKKENADAAKKGNTDKGNLNPDGSAEVITPKKDEEPTITDTNDGYVIENGDEIEIVLGDQNSGNTYEEEVVEHNVPKDVDVTEGYDLSNPEDNVSFVTPEPNKGSVEEIVVELDSTKAPDEKEEVTVNIGENSEDKVVEFSIEDENDEKNNVVEVEIGF